MCIVFDEFNGLHMDSNVRKRSNLSCYNDGIYVRVAFNTNITSYKPLNKLQFQYLIFTRIIYIVFNKSFF